MRVLMPIFEKGSDNPYVATLVTALRELKVDVVCSIQEFWNKWNYYDIIHIQWPDVLCENSSDIHRLSIILDQIRNEGKKIVVTCHNFQAHYSNNTSKNDAYGVVYSRADVIVHLGSYSYNLFKGIYPNSLNVIIPHHVYDQLYSTSDIPPKQVALKKLGLNPSYHYILCFGAFPGCPWCGGFLARLVSLVICTK